MSYYPTLKESQQRAANAADRAKLAVEALDELKIEATLSRKDSHQRRIRYKVLDLIGPYGPDGSLISKLARMHGKDHPARTAVILALAEPVLIARVQTYAKLMQVMAIQDAPAHEQHAEEQDAEED